MSRVKGVLKLPSSGRGRKNLQAVPALRGGGVKRERDGLFVEGFFVGKGRGRRSGRQNTKSKRGKSEAGVGRLRQGLVVPVKAAFFMAPDPNDKTGLPSGKTGGKTKKRQRCTGGGDKKRKGEKRGKLKQQARLSRQRAISWGLGGDLGQVREGNPSFKGPKRTEGDPGKSRFGRGGAVGRRRKQGRSKKITFSVRWGGGEGKA